MVLMAPFDALDGFRHVNYVAFLVGRGGWFYNPANNAAEHDVRKNRAARAGTPSLRCAMQYGKKGNS